MTELGDLLREARQKKGVSVSDAASATRIKQPYIEALEHGDYTQLPGAAYTTGFLRNYARYVGLHPDDVVQEYYESRPTSEATVKAATRVLATGHEREYRRRVLWTLAGVILLLCGGYAIKEYNDTYAKPYSPPLVTPSNAGSGIVSKPQTAHASALVHLRLLATAPVWVRVTADNHRVFQGIMRVRRHARTWVAHGSIYVVTYDGAHLKAAYNGHAVGRIARRSGLTVSEASASGWRHIS